MMYESAKKQLKYTLKVIREEIKERDDAVNTYFRLMADAQEKGNEEDTDFWFAAFADERTKRDTLKDILFQIEHPDIFDQD